LGAGKGALARESIADKSFAFISYADLFATSNALLFESPRQKLTRLLESALIKHAQVIILGHLDELAEEAGVWAALTDPSDGWFSRLELAKISVICTVDSNYKALSLFQDHFLHRICLPITGTNDNGLRHADLESIAREVQIGSSADLMKRQGRTCAQLESRTTGSLISDLSINNYNNYNNNNNNYNTNTLTLDTFYGIEENFKTTLLKHATFSFGAQNNARGALLFGPPGTGKTRLALALANSLGRETRLIVLAAADLLRAEIGSSEVKLREAFRLARASQPSLIFFDEIDSIFPKNPPFHLLTLQQQLVAEFDALEVAQISSTEPIRIFVLAATNFPDKVEKRILLAGRIELKLEMGLPSLEQRKEILEKALLRVDDESIDWAHGFSQNFIDTLARKTQHKSPADLNKIVQDARKRCWKRHAERLIEADFSS
jgi:AAA+ superfamily predicted ATPase